MRLATAWAPSRTRIRRLGKLLETNLEHLISSGAASEAKSSLLWHSSVTLIYLILTQFWANFKAIFPQHPIFDQYVEMHRVIPYYLHGDGGRGYKKDPIEILSMFPALGCGTRKRHTHSFLIKGLVRNPTKSTWD